MSPVWPILGGLAALVGRLLAGRPEVVAWHRGAGYALVSTFLQPISRAVSFSLGEVLTLVLCCLLTAAFLRSGLRGFYWLGFVAGLVVLAFYLSWGIAYRYPPLSERLEGRTKSGEDTRPGAFADVTSRSARLLARASEAAGALEGSDTEFLTRINLALHEGRAALPAGIAAASVEGVDFGSVKISGVSFALSRLQLSGYYFPWTGEAQINAEMPRSLWPRVAAHEQAHQRGFARENEATVVGLLVCLRSTDPAVFYSGALGLFAAFDRDLARIDADALDRIRQTLPRRVKEDFGKEFRFWKAHEGLGGWISERTNDTYLKAQGISSGVASYQETTRLLLQAMQTPGLPLQDLLDLTQGGGSPELGKGSGKGPVG